MTQHTETGFEMNGPEGLFFCSKTENPDPEESLDRQYDREQTASLLDRGAVNMTPGQLFDRYIELRKAREALREAREQERDLGGLALGAV